jgi:hypothetical protein
MPWEASARCLRDSAAAPGAVNSSIQSACPAGPLWRRGRVKQVLQAAAISRAREPTAAPVSSR